ncbi:MAG: ATPase, T2SS/T4P/T4SS family [Kofleriaceae bacterium]
MSAIPSLFRIMALRDADSLHLETGKIPELRRRGRVEPMALPALEAELVEDFVHRVTTDTDRAMLQVGSVAVTFVDPDGAPYTVSVHRAGAGYQLVGRRVSSGRAAPLPRPAAAPSAPREREVPGEAAGARAAAPAIEPAREAAGAPLAALALGPTLAGAVASAHQRGASDLFVSTGRGAMARLGGALQPLEGVHTDEEELWALLRAAELRARARAPGRPGEAGSADFGAEIDGVRVRCNVFAHLEGVALAVRVLSDAPPALHELGLPAGVEGALGHRHGLILVCGPTGSGKSTTCAALLQHLDTLRPAHVITLEDPIEARLRFRAGLVHQRELGAHFDSFAGGLRAALRESPDVLFLGELRDAETIAAALTAAETGHLVLATLHAPDAAGALDRVLDAFEDGRQRQARTQLAGALRMILTQRLVPRQRGGRVVAAELVPVTPAVANILRKGELQTLATAIQSGREAGMVPLERSLAQLVRAGLISQAEAQRACLDPALLRSQLG